MLIVDVNEKKSDALEEVIKNHPFKEYLGFTKKYKGFEIPNLNNEIKLSVLKKLSAENWREVPAFAVFWDWFKKNHGTAISKQICNHLFPGDESFRTYMVNCMRAQPNHDWWSHIKARVYKMWCSILTEMQAVYAVLYGSKKLNLGWKVLASARLDAMGIDMMFVANEHVYPIQIKKDSYHQQAQHKKNAHENFSRFVLNKKVTNFIFAELKKEKMDSFILEEGILLKYDLPDKKGNDTYDYLGHFENGFVYFDRIRLVKSLQKIIGQSNFAQNLIEQSMKEEFFS